MDEAEEVLSSLAEAGDPPGLFKLADWNYRGIGRTPNLSRAFDLFRAAADGGVLAARYFVTNMLANGSGGTRDWSTALRRLEDEATSEPRRKHALDAIGRMRLTSEGDPVDVPPKQVVSERPYIAAFTEFLTPSECGYLAQVAHPLFAPAVIRDTATGREYRDPVRTSDTAILHSAIEDPAVHAINRRIAAITGTDVTHGEPLQVFRYAPGQEFRRHVDADMKSPNVRTVTVLVYLNDDYDGGETVFTQTGMFVRGGTGDAVMFRSTLPSGELDPSTEHAGRPVLRGTKLLASRWICAGKYVPDNR
jgi:prolyl 4-hydroxylase